MDTTVPAAQVRFQDIAPPGSSGRSGPKRMNAHSTISAAIDAAALNRGVEGARWLENEANIPILFPTGDIALFEHEGERDYQGHTLFVTTGKEAIRSGREALRIMFEDHRANLIFGLTPVDLRHVKIFNRLLGFKSAGIRATTEGPCELFVLSKEMWKGR